jgi:KilA domain-containing protein
MEASADTKAIIVRQLEAMPVGQRAGDGYIDATAMCQAAGKEWSNYRQLQGTEAFLDELAQSLGIPRGLLTHSITSGPRHERGTWIHPQVAVNLAQWCSPRFAVLVSAWVVEWATTGENPLHKIPITSLYNNEPLQKAVSITYHTYLSRTNGDFAVQNAELCKTHSDWHWLPSQYVLWAKRQQWRSKDRTSGLQVLRIKEPPSVAAITTEKWAIMCGAKEPDARRIAAKFKEVAQLCLEAGITSTEMQAPIPDKRGGPQGDSQ